MPGTRRRSCCCASIRYINTMHLGHEERYTVAMLSSTHECVYRAEQTFMYTIAHQLRWSHLVLSKCLFYLFKFSKRFKYSRTVQSTKYIWYIIMPLNIHSSCVCAFPLKLLCINSRIPFRIQVFIDSDTMIN